MGFEQSALAEITEQPITTIGLRSEPFAVEVSIQKCEYIVSFRQVCGGAVRSSLAEIPVRLSRRRIRARTVRERTAIWPA
ncbi:MAG: hypothetical protein ACREYE_18780, partial [Gammaproteobacteria bacterium]